MSQKYSISITAKRGDTELAEASVVLTAFPEGHPKHLDQVEMDEKILAVFVNAVKNAYGVDTSNLDDSDSGWNLTDDEDYDYEYDGEWYDE